MESLNRQLTKQNTARPVKVIQFGTGNFLRGFASWMVDVLNEKSNFDASIQVIKNTKSASESDLNSQDGLYHLAFSGKMNGKLVNETRLITCINKVINPYFDYQEFLSIGLEKNLQLIFSNTTEQGIYFDRNDSDIKTCPDSFGAKLTALLYHRFKNYDAIEEDTIAVVPTELIENNGDELKKVVLQYIFFWGLESEFIQYINQHIYFYNTLVDRIVPGFPAADATKIYNDTGFIDQFIVKAEPYYVLILQGDAIISEIFPAAKNGLNVKLVPDIAPFRTLKVRILNGLHSVMVPVALLRGIRTVKEVMQDEYCRNYIEKTVYSEIIPSLEIDESEALAYVKSVFERYENPYVEHLLQSISLNSISKFRVRVLPSILDYYSKFDQLPENLVFSMSNLIVFYKGTYKTQEFQLKDDPEYLLFFKTIWSDDFSEQTVKIMLENELLWEQNLDKIVGLRKMIFQQINDILKET